MYRLGPNQAMYIIAQARLHIYDQARTLPFWHTHHIKQWTF